MSVGAIGFGSFLLTKKQYDTLQTLQNDLFPPTETFSINTIGARGYIVYILQHPRVSQETKQFIRNGINWLNEEALKVYGSPYGGLSKEKRELILDSISQQSWGESLIETILMFIFEALLGDPIYGINKDEVGWRWLEHKPGEPRPVKRYDG